MDRFPVYDVQVSLITPMTSTLLLALVLHTATDSLRPNPVPMVPEGLSDAHHTTNGFRNVHGVHDDPSGWRVFKWLLSRPFARKPSQAPAPVVRDGADLSHPVTGVRITWVGHATTVLTFPDLVVLTDPVFARRVSPVSFAGPKREHPLPIPLDSIPRVDVVVISHDHYDHLDRQAIRALHARHNPLFVVPLGVDRHVRRWTGSSRIVALDWWHAIHLPSAPYTLTLTPAAHFSGRSLVRDRTLWGGFAIERHGDAPFRLLYAGDTGYGTHFREMRERLWAPDVVLMPIGANEPRWLMAPVHVNGEEAVRAWIDLEARHLIPIHWGTFDLADETLEQPVRDIHEAAVRTRALDRLHVMAAGTTLTFSSPLAQPEPSVPNGRITAVFPSPL